jgi:hypothetical protein
LLGGDAFTLSYIASNNGLDIKSSVLIDLGANGYAFVNTTFAELLSQYLDISYQELKTPSKVRGFDRAGTTAIS